MHSVQSRSEALTGPNDGPGLGVGGEGGSFYVGEEQRCTGRETTCCVALGKSRTVSEPHSSPSQTYDSIHERAVKEQMWRSGLRSCLGIISHDPRAVPYGGYREHLRFTEEETEALRGGLESPGHAKSRQHANSVWVPGQNPEPSPVYSLLPTPSCVQMGVSRSRLDGRLCGS